MDENEKKIESLKQEIEWIWDRVEQIRSKLTKEMDTRFFEIYHSDSHLKRISIIDEKIFQIEQNGHREINEIRKKITDLEWIKE